MIAEILGLALLGYLLGSIPLAWIVTWLVTRKDLRTLGSGTVGVMNVALSVTRFDSREVVETALVWAQSLLFRGRRG